MRIESSKPIKKKDKEFYIQLCLKIWGCVPIDYDWATRTSIYKNGLESLNDKSKDGVESRVNLTKI